MLFRSCSATHSGKCGPSNHARSSASAVPASRFALAHALFSASHQIGTVFDSASGNRFTALAVASTIIPPLPFAHAIATRRFSLVADIVQLLLCPSVLLK